MTLSSVPETKHLLIFYQTNCLTETFFDEADSRARQLDQLRQDGKLAGPLHGLPISLKDSFQVAGTQATLGLVAYPDEFSDTNSPLVEILVSLGAVPFVKTNIPQTLMVNALKRSQGRALSFLTPL